MTTPDLHRITPNGGKPLVLADWQRRVLAAELSPETVKWMEDHALVVTLPPSPAPRPASPELVTLVADAFNLPPHILRGDMPVHRRTWRLRRRLRIARRRVIAAARRFGQVAR